MPDLVDITSARETAGTRFVPRQLATYWCIKEDGVLFEVSASNPSGCFSALEELGIDIVNGEFAFLVPASHVGRSGDSLRPVIKSSDGDMAAALRAALANAGSTV